MEDPPKFSFHLMRRHRSAMDRQIFEALAIEKEVNDITMNNKAEFGRNFIPRMILDPDTSAWETQKSTQESSQKHKRDANGFMGPKCKSDDVGQSKPNTHSEIH